MVAEILIKMIAAGGSTYASKRAKEGAVIINDDSIVSAVHGGNYKLYSKKLKPLYKKVEHTIAREAKKLGRDIVFDSPNLDLPRRKRLIDFIKRELKIPIVATCFKIDTPEAHANRRYWADSRSYGYAYWLDVARYHLNNYTQPSIEEGFDLIRNVSFEEGFLTTKEEKAIELQKSQCITEIK